MIIIAAITWIESDQISGGSKIDLLARSLTAEFNNNLGVPEIPGKDVAESFANKLHEVDYFGMANPRYTVEGQFDASTATSAGGSVCLSIPIMGSFQRLGSPSWFYDEEFIMDSVGSCQVLVAGFKPKRVARTGSTVAYNLTLVETKAW